MESSIISALFILNEKLIFFLFFLSFHPIWLLNTQKHLIGLKGTLIYLTVVI